MAPTEQRLKAGRGTWAAPLPGHALVGLDPQRLWMTEVCVHAEGQAQERRWMAQVRQHVQAEDLGSAARHFGTLGLMVGMARRGAAFVVRPHGQVPGALGGQLTRQGASRRGPVYDQALRVRDPAGGETRRGRRLTVQLPAPTRNGDTPRPILRHVPPHRAAAAQLARGYGTRWRSATALCASTTPLACESNPLGYPPAALLTFGLAWLAYHAVALSKAALRRAHGRQKIKAAVSSA